MKAISQRGENDENAVSIGSKACDIRRGGMNKQKDVGMEDGKHTTIYFSRTSDRNTVGINALLTDIVLKYNGKEAVTSCHCICGFCYVINRKLV